MENELISSAFYATNDPTLECISKQLSIIFTLSLLRK